MKLGSLLNNVEVAGTIGVADREVAGVAYYTQDLVKGGCFVAISGTMSDGHDYIQSAIDRGASVIVCSKKPALLDENVTYVLVNDTRSALAVMSSNFFGEPTKEVRLVGITGTNGKTTITYLLESIWKANGEKTGVIGTVNYRYGNIQQDPQNTTPQSYELQKLIRDMIQTGVSSVAMEVSSHSLVQERVVGCNFDGAIFTNLTQDHLDYHLDMDRYAAAKGLLFTRSLPLSSKKNVWAVINRDDQYGVKIAGNLKSKVYLYSLSRDADIFIENAEYSLTGMKLKLRVLNERMDITSPMIGKHNASNILAAVSAARAMNIRLDIIKKGIEAVVRIPGRLEPVTNSRGLNVFVDYAHTPDALKNVTSSLKELKPSRLITVFGCGGDRDKTKRPLMGYEAAIASDLVVVTSDNPRTEDPQKIIDEIIQGVKRSGVDDYIVEPDRREAIKLAIKSATRADLVLIAGKGHENYQIIGSKRTRFDDVIVAREIMDEC